MTDLFQSPARPPSPFRLPPPPLPGQPFDPPQDFFAPAPPPQSSAPPQYSPQDSAPAQSSAPSQHSAPPQYSAGPTGSLSAESKLPLIALICGIVSWLGLWMFTAIPAIIFGVKGRREAREGRTPNGGMATAGLWLGVTNLVIGTIVFLLIVTAIPVFLSQRAKGIDAGLKSDLTGMATLQETYIMDNPTEMGFEVAATSPGGKATALGGTLPTHPGNVIEVKVGPGGYCVTGYNPGASRAKSPTASMVYLSADGGLQSAVGVC
jgi:type IV pilus assembly protein PilA